MTYEEYKNSLPDYAKDIKLNLSNLHNQFEQSGLSKSQFYGAALAVAYTLKNSRLIQIYKNLIQSLDNDNLYQAIRIATTLMAMNNVYYRTAHLSEDKTISTMPAGLRMNGLRTHGIEQMDFEIFALAVSAVNGCGMCIQSHLKQLLEHGLSAQSIQTIFRISAILTAADQAESMIKE